MNHQGWEAGAICRQFGGDMWFPDHERKEGYAAAIEICDGCPLKAPCLRLALHAETGTRANGRHGIFGGFTPHERAATEFELQHGTNSCYVIDLCRCPPCTAASNTTKRPKAALAA